MFNSEWVKYVHIYRFTSKNNYSLETEYNTHDMHDAS